MMKTLRRLALFAGLGLAALSLSGCGENIEIPPAHVGKISSSNGLQENILTPSKIWFTNMCWTCDGLVLAEVSDYAMEEEMTILSTDKLNVTFDVRGTFATSEDPGALNLIFNRIPALATNNERVSIIPSTKVYEVYVKQLIRERVRTIMSKYSTTEIMANREAIGAEMNAAIVEALKGRPVKVLNFGLADVTLPKVIIDAEEKAKEREIKIKETESDEEIRVRKAQADLKVAELEQAVELKQAETDVLVEQKLSEGFNRSFLMRRGLAVLQAMAESDNKVIFLPTEAFSNPALLVGAMNQADAEDDTNTVVSEPQPAAQP